ncbi:PrgI family protein [Yinghuangia soli]|uniref:PrgI family protein n=1 Tax=Yinghuangia soli TaxID=2908204 RepID=A0AA41Q5U3_9ACTN|nr:PrgI family protein [Yinghuangia soli]MCF2531186.1 PrgI family protein [Yinghuangia soli]
MTRANDERLLTVRIPADIDREDRLLLNLTPRQLLILIITALLLYVSWRLVGALEPAIWLAGATPVAVSGVVVALGSRDGVSLDRFVAAGVRWRVGARAFVLAPEGVHQAPDWLARRAIPADGDAKKLRTTAAPLALPAQDVAEPGVVDLGADGLALVAVCGTVDFGLRTPTEQESLVAGFGGFLQSLSSPVQVLVRVERLDLSRQVSELYDQAEVLPDQALSDAARAHADYLGELSRSQELLCRQVLLVLREVTSRSDADREAKGAGLFGSRRRQGAERRRGSGAGRAAEARLRQRLNEARDLLAPSGISVRALDAAQATAVLAAACNPAGLVHSSGAVAPAGDVIRASGGADIQGELDWGTTWDGESVDWTDY